MLHLKCKYKKGEQVSKKEPNLGQANTVLDLDCEWVEQLHEESRDETWMKPDSDQIYLSLTTTIKIYLFA